MSPTASSPAPEPGDVIDGKLRVDAVLGRGGMGVVYQVTHLKTQHPRALKVLARDALDRDSVTRLGREAAVSGLVASDVIVQTLDAGVLADGAPYLLMELLSGESLAARVARGPIASSWLLPRLLPVVEALAAAHERGIVHRDIKPSNLFVETKGDDERIRLLDFGIARFAMNETGDDGALTNRRALLGTPLYMAPEQLDSARSVDGRADVYALGVVMFEALSGQRPYEVASMAELVACLRGDERAALDEVQPGLLEGLYDLVDAALSIDPRERITMAELGRRLRALLELGEAPTALSPDTPRERVLDAEPPSTISRPSSHTRPEPRTSRRPRRTLAVALVLAGVGLAGLATAFALAVDGTATSDAPPSSRATRAQAPLAPAAAADDDDAPGPAPTPALVERAPPADRETPAIDRETRTIEGRRSGHDRRAAERPASVRTSASSSNQRPAEQAGLDMQPYGNR